MVKSRFESIGVYTPEKIMSSQEIVDQLTIKPGFDFVELTGI